MRILLENLSKRYNRQWIFKDVNLEFTDNNSYAIIGPNGSGKSTFLKILLGATPASSGNIIYQKSSEIVDEGELYKHSILAAPYLELIEEFTTKELLGFHFKFKRLKLNYTINDILEIAYLHEHANKPIKQFSSGMKQRLKLALAFYSDTPILMLDEPTTNLDERAKEWYYNEIAKCFDRMIIVASNDKPEYAFCKKEINILDYIV